MSFDQRDGSAGLPEGFAELPPLVYADDPRWIPEDPQFLRLLFSPANPWLARGRARLFSRPDQARAAAFFHPDAKIGGKPIAFFGYWETRATPEVDAELLDAVAGWAREQGAAELWGPTNFSTAGNYRLILSHEPDFQPFPGEPYNRPDYPARLLRSGFGIGERYASHLCGEDAFAQILGVHREVRDRLLGQGYRFEPVDLAAWERHQDELFVLCNEAFADNLGFVPFGRIEFAMTTGVSLVKKADPEASRLVLGPGGDVAAFYLAFPDYGPLVAQGASDRVAGAQLEFGKHFARLANPRYIAKTVAVATRHRRRGIWDGVFADSLERSLGRYPAGLMGALVRDDNFTGRVFQPTLRHKREYGLFRRAL